MFLFKLSGIIELTIRKLIKNLGGIAMNEKERIIELVKKNIISMDEALDLLEASANKDVTLTDKEDLETEATTEEVVREEIKGDSKTGIDINDIMDSVFTTGKDVASNISDYIHKVTQADKAHQDPAEVEEVEEAQEEFNPQEEADSLAQLAEIEIRLLEIEDEIDQVNEDLIIHKQRLREIEIFAEMDDLTEEMEENKEELEVRLAELEDKLAKLQDDKSELTDQKEDLNSPHKSYKTDDFKSFINDSSETISETASKFGKEMGREGKRWGKFISERSKSLIDNFNSKDINLSFKVPWIKSVREDYQFVFPFNHVEDIELEVYNGSVELLAYEGTDLLMDAEVRFHGNHDEISKQQFESLSTIVNEDNRFVFKVNSPRISMDAKIKVPSQLYHRIYLNLLNGDIGLQGLNAEHLIVSNKNGDLNLTATRVEESNFDLLNGDIVVVDSPIETFVAKNLNGDIRLDGYVNNVTVEALNADIFLSKRNRTASNIKAKTISGDIKISIPESLNVNIDAKTTSGSLLNRLSQLDNVDQDSSTKSSYVHRIISGDQEIVNVIASTTSGDIYLKDSQATL